jgi:hypothetical protein
LPVYGEATVFRPAGQIQHYELDGGYGTDALRPAAASAEWQTDERLADQIVTELAGQTGRPPICAFGFQDRFFNPSTLWLESSSEFHSPIPSMWLSQSFGSTAGQVSLWLDVGEASSVNVLITAGGLGPSEIPPAIDQGVVGVAAAASGFKPARHMALPNGVQLTFWVRAKPPAFNNPYPFQPGA